MSFTAQFGTVDSQLGNIELGSGGAPVPQTYEATVAIAAIDAVGTPIGGLVRSNTLTIAGIAATTEALSYGIFVTDTIAAIAATAQQSDAQGYQISFTIAAVASTGTPIGLLAAEGTVTIAAIDAAVGTMWLGAVGIVTIHAIDSFAPGSGQVYIVTCEIASIATIAEIIGNSYDLTSEFDGIAAYTFTGVQFQDLALSIDGVAATTLSVYGLQNITVVIAAIDAAAVLGQLDFVISTTINAIATCDSENLFNVLYSTFAYAAVTIDPGFHATGIEHPQGVSAVGVSIQAVFHRTVTQTLVFGQDASFEEASITESQTIVFTQHASVLKSFIHTFTQTIVFTQAGVQSREPGPQVITFGQTIGHIRVHNRYITQSLVFNQVVGRPMHRVRSITQTLVFNPANIQALPLHGPVNPGEKSIQAYYTIPVCYVYKNSPRCITLLGVAQQTVVLPCPQLNDTQSYSGTMALKRTMTGDTYTYVTSSKLNKLKYTFFLGRQKSLELRDFLLAYNTQLMTLINWKGENWLGYLVNNPYELVAKQRYQNQGERVDITIEFEGVKIGG